MQNNPNDPAKDVQNSQNTEEKSAAQILKEEPPMPSDKLKEDLKNKNTENKTDANTNKAQEPNQNTQSDKVNPNEEFKVNIQKLSKKTLDFFKKAGKQIMKKEEESKEENVKGVYAANAKTNYIHEFFSHRQNLGLTLSVLALAISSIAFLKSGDNATGAFIEAENDVTTQTVAHLDKNGDEVPQVQGIIFADQKAFELAVANAVKSQHLIPEKVEGGDGTGSLTKQQFNARVAQALEDIRTAQLIGEIKAKKEKYSNAANTVPEERHLYGNVNARFVIKEFSDLECPYCKRFFETPKAVADRSNGQVAVEWFHTPLSFHDPVATNEAVATECVAKLGGNRAFWASLQHIFDTTYGNGQGTPILGNIPKAFELNDDAYLSCINDKSLLAKIEKSKQLAASYGISGTPASVIVDTKTGHSVTVSGAQDASALMNAIENLNAQEEPDNVEPEAHSEEVATAKAPANN